LNGVGYIGVLWNSNSIFKASMFGGIDLKGELVTLVLVGEAGTTMVAIAPV